MPCDRRNTASWLAIKTCVARVSGGDSRKKAQYGPVSTYSREKNCSSGSSPDVEAACVSAGPAPSATGTVLSRPAPAPSVTADAPACCLRGASECTVLAHPLLLVLDLPRLSLPCA
jgi:hypothetical protein